MLGVPMTPLGKPVCHRNFPVRLLSRRIEPR
jgi:hypothetical protein